MSETKKLNPGTNGATGRLPSLTARLVCLGVFFLLSLLLVAAFHLATWHQLERLQNDFAARKAEVFHLGIQLQKELERANRELMQAQLSRNNSELETRFRQRIKSAQKSLANTLPLLGTPEEQQAARQLENALEKFLEDAQGLLDKELKAVRRDSAALVAARIDQLSAPLFSACQRLVDAQKSAWLHFLADSENAAGKLQLLTLLAILLQTILILLVALLIHRLWVRPLQARLDDSHARLERHEKLASLGTLAAGVAHEIRNPLTAIKFRLFSLKKSLPKDYLASEDLQVVESELKRLERITGDFLQFARPSKPELSDVSTTRLLEELHQLMKPQLERRGIQLCLDIATDYTLRADRQQLLQVLINLTQNAAESIENHGTITLRTRRRDVRRGSAIESTVIIEVADTGRGIPPEAQRRLFDPFFSTKAGGTGLGLCIAEGIVSRHGGTLEYQTIPGRGTTFMVVLPLQQKHETQNTHHRG